MRKFSVGFLCGVFFVLAASALTPDAPMCELLSKSGLVPVSDPKPEFSWIFRDALPGDCQTAYRIQVATTTELFKTDQADLWDSGRVKSGQSLFVQYAGKPLPAGTQVFWRVCAWDKKGNRGPWSQLSGVQMAEKLSGDVPVRYSLDETQIQPVRIATNDLGHVFVDFGRAAFGWIELLPPRDSPRGPFLFHVGEKAVGNSVDTNPGGTVRYAKIRGALTRPGIYRVPLAADARNTSGSAIALPKELGVVMPFRYVEVEDCPYPVTRESIRQIAVHYPFDDASSSFESSDANLNRVYDLCKYSVKATSFAGIYVDGDRERIPYEADAYINQLCHYCTDREFTLARYTHEYLMTHPTWPTEWKQHSVMIAWTDWMYTGNTKSLERCYEALKSEKLLLSAAREKDGLLVTGGSAAPMASGLRDIVDWPVGERDGFDFKPVNAVVNAFYCLNLRQMADMAQALGKGADAELFRGKAEKAVAAFNAVFFDAAKGRYVDGEGSAHSSLHANMLPLAFGLVPDAERSRVVDFVRSRGMSCSVYGAQYLLEALFSAGADDEAVALLTRDGLRSWMNMLRSGSTITLEAWDARLKPNLDWNHAWGAAPANLIPRYVLGVRPLAPGFAKALVRPQLGGLARAKGLVPTIRGGVKVEAWQVPQKAFRVSMELPVGLPVRVEIPAPPAGVRVYVDGRRASLGEENGRVAVEGLSAGEHTVAWQAKELTACESNGVSDWRGTSAAGLRAWLPSF